MGEALAKPRLTKPPKLVTFVEAEYPEAERSEGSTASVVLQIAIGERGEVTDAKVLESAGPNFDAAALAAVRGFVFEPAEIDGKPAAIRINYRYEFVFRDAAPTYGVLTGVVRLRDGAPLSGVAVALDNGASAVTDAEGRFHFDELAPGKYRVLLSRDDLKTLQTEESVEAGQKLESTYEVEFEPLPSEGDEEEVDDLEIVVTAPKLTKQTVSTRVDAKDAKRVAGTQGDVLKIVENLPGVARATAGSGRLVVWGAAPEDTRVYVDGVRVPLLYHFGGLRSIVPSELVSSVELVPGAYGSPYGRGLGGLVKVDTRDPSLERVRGGATLDLLDASVAAHGPVAGDYQFALAGRRSHLDFVLNQATDDDLDEFFPIPRYYDAQAKLRKNFSPTESLELSGLLSSDTLSRGTASRDPADRKRETRELDFQRVSLRYQKAHADGTKVDVVPWFGRDGSSLETQFGGIPSLLEVDATVFGLRASVMGRVTPSITGTAGIDVEASSTSARRRGSFSTPGREGDTRAFGQPPSDQINTDTWESVIGSAAPFVEADVELAGGALHIVPGLRLDPYFVSVNRRVPADADVGDIGAYSSNIAVEPRLSTRIALSKRATIKAAYGEYRQPPLPEDLSAVFGNPLLGASSARHVLFGGAFELFPGLSLETTAFYTQSEGLAVRNPVSAPLVAEALVGIGEGRSFGTQFLLRREAKDGVFGWIAYTLLRSERRDEPGAAYRLFDYDQTHVLTALAAYALGAGFDIGARFRFSSGYPRTEVTGAYYDARRDLYEPTLGPHNGIRIPYFAELDVRAAKRWTFGTNELEVYVDVQNVTNRGNAEEIAYSSDYSTKRYIEGLPILPVAGATFGF